MQKRIDKIFFKKKSIPVDLFLDKILYHKKLGYYQKKNPFGKKGDFVTAPNISNVFSEMIAIWFVSFWENLNRPDRINFIELGPGNGDFSLSFINTLKRFPNLSKATKIYLYERSEKLIGIQKKKINSRKVSWVKNFDRINDGPVIFFGNEFLDALPINSSLAGFITSYVSFFSSCCNFPSMNCPNLLYIIFFYGLLFEIFFFKI